MHVLALDKHKLCSPLHPFPPRSHSDLSGLSGGGGWGTAAGGAADNDGDAPSPTAPASPAFFPSPSRGGGGGGISLASAIACCWSCCRVGTACGWDGAGAA